MEQASRGGRPRAGRALRALLVLAVVAASPACKLDTYTFGGGDDVTGDGGLDDGGVDDGGGGGDGGAIDAAVPDACIGFPEEVSPQACNEVDDDCNGVVDDGFDLTIDNA